MKFLHLSDLHLGKVVEKRKEISREAKKALERSLLFMAKEGISTVIISGDLFNEPTSDEGKKVFAWYIEELIKRGYTALMIFGNHDKAENLDFDLEDLKKKRIFIATKIEDALHPISVEDCDFYLLPYVSKKDIKRVLGKGVDSLGASDSFACLFASLPVDKSRKNVLLMHRTVKDLDLDKVFAPFDYCALGHVHSLLGVSPKARYAGSLLEFKLNKLDKERKYTVVTTDPFKIETL